MHFTKQFKTEEEIYQEFKSLLENHKDGDKSCSIKLTGSEEIKFRAIAKMIFEAQCPCKC